MTGQRMWAWVAIVLGALVLAQRPAQARTRPRARPENWPDILPDDPPETTEEAASWFWDFFSRSRPNVNESIDAPDELGSASDFLDQFKGSGANV